MSSAAGARRLVAVLVAVAALACAGLLDATAGHALAAGWPSTPSAHHAEHALPAAAHEPRRPSAEATGHPAPLSADATVVGPDLTTGVRPGDRGDRRTGVAAAPHRSDRAPPTAA